MPLLPPLVLEVGNGPQVLTFRNSTFLDPQVGLTKNLGVRHQPSDVEGDDRQGSLRHGLEELGRLAGRTIPGGCPVQVLSFAG
jgi:hypothetical protein